MNSVIQEKKSGANTAAEWPDEIIDLFKPDFSILFAEDFPSCADPRNATAEDLVFLNLPIGASLNQIVTAFGNSKCYLWFNNLIKEHENQEMHYGAISASLHSSLLNEPKPYRKDVKQLLSNLLNWIEVLQIDEIRIDRPNHSQRVRHVIT